MSEETTPPKVPGEGLNGWVEQLGRALNLRPDQVQMLRRLIVVGLVGGLILLAADLLNLDGSTRGASQRQPPDSTAVSARGSLSGPSAAAAAGAADLAAWEKRLSEELQTLLSKVEGAGQVTAWVRLQSGPQQSVAQNTNTVTRRTTERDKNGLTRETVEENQQSQAVMARTEDRPLVLKVEGPKVASVLVVAEGARFPEVRARLVRAVEAAFGLPAHRIQVVPTAGGLTQEGRMR